jgi:hypothetical protein
MLSRVDSSRRICRRSVCAVRLALCIYHWVPELDSVIIKIQYAEQILVLECGGQCNSEVRRRLPLIRAME